MKSKFDLITEKYKTLPYMTEEQAHFFKKIIQENKFTNLCELGTYHGKGSLYLASILEEQGFGCITTFDKLSTKITPTIYDLINEFQFSEIIKPVVSAEGYIWDLAKLVLDNKSKFDFCYIDGGHSFETTGLGFVLIDLLLEKNGIVVFDDYHWSVNTSNVPIFSNHQTDIQKQSKPVKMVCDIIVRNYNYKLVTLDHKLNFAVYRKL